MAIDRYGHETEFFQCSCIGGNEHLFKLVLYPPGDSYFAELYLFVNLTTYRSFFKRLWVGLRYVFGYKSKYGDWDATIIQSVDIPRMEKLLRKYKKYLKEDSKSVSKTSA